MNTTEATARAMVKHPDFVDDFEGQAYVPSWALEYWRHEYQMTDALLQKTRETLRRVAGQKARARREVLVWRISLGALVLWAVLSKACGAM